MAQVESVITVRLDNSQFIELAALVMDGLAINADVVHQQMSSGTGCGLSYDCATALRETATAIRALKEPERKE